MNRQQKAAPASRNTHKADPKEPLQDPAKLPKARATGKAKAAPKVMLAAPKPQPEATVRKVEMPPPRPVKIQRQDTSLSSTDAREILNRQSTADQLTDEGLKAIGEGAVEEKEKGKKRVRDPVAHARRNRFYRSLDSWSLSSVVDIELPMLIHRLCNVLIHWVGQV